MDVFPPKVIRIVLLGRMHRGVFILDQPYNSPRVELLWAGWQIDFIVLATAKSKSPWLLLRWTSGLGLAHEQNAATFCGSKTREKLYLMLAFGVK